MKKPRIPSCPACGDLGVRDEKYDAYACAKCDAWLEEKCKDTACGFCADRPEKPSQREASK